MPVCAARGRERARVPCAALRRAVRVPQLGTLPKTLTLQQRIGRAAITARATLYLYLRPFYLTTTQRDGDGGWRGGAVVVDWRVRVQCLSLRQPWWRSCMDVLQASAGLLASAARADCLIPAAAGWALRASSNARVGDGGGVDIAALSCVCVRCCMLSGLHSGGVVRLGGGVWRSWCRLVGADGARGAVETLGGRVLQAVAGVIAGSRETNAQVRACACCVHVPCMCLSVGCTIA